MTDVFGTSRSESELNLEAGGAVMSRFQLRMICTFLLVPVSAAIHLEGASLISGAAYCRMNASQEKDQDLSSKQMKFKILLQGEMIDTEEHIHLAITTYKASDGAGLVLIHNEFASSATAQDYFEKVMGKAQKTIERGKKKDKAGNVVGVRAEAIVPTGPSGKPMQAIVLTFGGHFYEIKCDSPSTSRALEMRLTSSN